MGADWPSALAAVAADPLLSCTLQAPFVGGPPVAADSAAVAPLPSAPPCLPLLLSARCFPNSLGDLQGGQTG